MVFKNPKSWISQWLLESYKGNFKIYKGKYRKTSGMQTNFIKQFVNRFNALKLPNQTQNTDI